MSYILSQKLSDKASDFPECSYGACSAILVLSSGNTINGVILAWGSEIISINGKAISSNSSLPFNISEVVDVLQEKQY